MSSGPNNPAKYSSNNLGYHQGSAPHARQSLTTSTYSNGSMYAFGVQDNGGRGVTYDPEYEAQLAQWQSAYVSKDDSATRHTTKRDNTLANTGPAYAGDGATSHAQDSSHSSSKKPLTVVRHGGGKTWEDTSLLEWGDDPRLFVGNLAGEVTDDSLLKAFSKYNAAKARVIRDKRTSKSKGYGFVSFKNADDFFTAAKEMVNKYIGSHPVTIKKAEKLPTPSVIRDAAKQHNSKSRKNAFRDGHANTGSGVRKTQKPKGPKMLG